MIATLEWLSQHHNKNCREWCVHIVNRMCDVIDRRYSRPVIGAEPLTGRSEEQRAIRRALAGANNHGGVVMVGPAGVGKTRLAREMLSCADAAGERTHWIVGTESARRVPLGAFTKTITDAMCNPLPDVRRIISSFVAQQHRGRVLIGVDDAHLLDGLSAHVVHQLAQSRSVRLLVTIRAGEIAPDAITTLWKDGLLSRLDLAPFDLQATREFVEATLGSAVDSLSAKRFWKLTDGNPLFLTQVLKDQIAAGRMRQVAGVWMWDEGVAVSPSVGDLMAQQLGQLTPALMRVVDTLSQCEPLGLDLLCDLVDRNDLVVAEQLHLIAVERNGTKRSVRLAHPLFGEIRRADAGELHLSSIRGALAQRLGQDVDSDIQQTVRRALLTLESDLPADPDLFVTAARYAMTLLDLGLADRFATAAVAAGHDGAAEIKAMNLVLLGRGEQAEAILREMSEGGGGAGHRWATVRAANLTWMLGQPEEAARLLEELAREPESTAEQAERLAVQAGVDAVGARCVDAAANARAALESGTLSDFHTMLASVALVMASGALGRADDLDDVATRAMDRAAASFDASHMRFWFGGVYARACRLTGRIDECARFAGQLAESQKEVPALAYANLALVMGNADLVRGKVNTAVTLLHEALAGAEKHGVTTGLRPASCFSLAEAHAKLGQEEAARAALAEAQRSVPDGYLFMHTGLAIAAGWTLAAGGRLSDAVAVVAAAEADARQRHQPTHELACLQAATLWGDATGAPRARALAATLSIPLATVVARHAEALAANDGGELLAVSAQYRTIGDRASAADAAAQAAVAYAATQQSSRSRYATAQAQQLAEECGGLCTPALRIPAVPVRLTGRQREVAELVGVGLSNKEIADRLTTSLRTVEGHLYRACKRVGASSRTELAAIMRAGPGGRAHG